MDADANVIPSRSARLTWVLVLLDKQDMTSVSASDKSVKRDHDLTFRAPLMGMEML